MYITMQNISYNIIHMVITLSEIKEALKILSPDILKVEDHSDQHADHYAGSDTGITHVKILIKAECFQSLTKIQSHQKIYHSLDAVFKKGLHSVQITLL